MRISLIVAHSPDNSFMGFVIDRHLNDDDYDNVTKKQQAVVYGKDAKMWEVLRNLFYIVFNV